MFHIELLSYLPAILNINNTVFFIRGYRMIKSIFTAFLLVFLAELGDKTQLSTMLLASKSKSIWFTFIGSACALVLSSLLGVLAGSVINKFFSVHYIQICSGAAFILIGFLLLLGKM